MLTHGRAKLAAKGADLLVVNEVGRDRGFEAPDNAAVILGSDGTEVDVPPDQGGARRPGLGPGRGTLGQPSTTVRLFRPRSPQLA